MAGYEDVTTRHEVRPRVETVVEVRNGRRRRKRQYAAGSSSDPVAPGIRRRVVHLNRVAIAEHSQQPSIGQRQRSGVEAIVDRGCGDGPLRARRMEQKRLLSPLSFAAVGEQRTLSVVEIGMAGGVQVREIGIADWRKGDRLVAWQRVSAHRVPEPGRVG